MRTPIKYSITVLILSVVSLHAAAQGQYNNYKSMSLKISSFSKSYPAIFSSRPIIKTAGGKEIWALTIGTGEKESKPGIAVFGGVEGNHILGKELALGFAENLLMESSVPEMKSLLERITFYIFPDVSPDATEQYFSELKYERVVNARSTDDDRDFEYDEDPCEDLNKDGFISMLRITDPSGKHIESTIDKRVMVQADLAKGQTGSYLVYTEGIDNDKDGHLNEDGKGGVNFNRNFSFNYEEFGLNAGLHPVSEPETKAVADFLFDRFNIFAVFIFGPQDNLGQPLISAEKPEAGKRISSIMKSDETINKLVSEKYHEITGVKGFPAAQVTPGNFMEWVYFHYGRYSFSTPAWWFPVDKGENREIAFLKYAESHKIHDVFIPWKEVNHPDFPGKKAEIGGLKPFAMINPPSDTLGDIISGHYKFIIAISRMHADLEFLDIKTDNAGENIFRISLKVHNKGIFATCPEIGQENTWTRIMRISIETGKDQNVLSGQKVQIIRRLEGDQSAEFSWLINGKGAVKVNAGAVNTGTISATIELK